MTTTKKLVVVVVVATPGDVTWVTTTTARITGLERSNRRLAYRTPWAGRG
jgi:hypothetical protein